MSTPARAQTIVTANRWQSRCSINPPSQRTKIPSWRRVTTTPIRGGPPGDGEGGVVASKDDRNTAAYFSRHARSSRPW